MASSILIVEDEQLVALDIQRRLTQLGYHVVAIADSAETAIAAATEFHPNLILMDIRLKGDVDGIAAATHIQEQHHLPIVFLTAHADSATLTQAKSSHPYGYLIKPVETKHLSTAIEIALTRHEAEAVMESALQKEREFNTALQRALEREKELTELKSQLIAIVSHEFRNPLTAIMLSLEMLESQNDRFTAEQRLNKIRRAKTATDNLRQLVEDILALRDTEGNQFRCQPLPTNVLIFCRELADEFQAHLMPEHSEQAKHTIAFTYIGCPELPEPIYDLDVKLLRHILNNLLSNAAKYSPGRHEVDFELECRQASILFRVRDRGIGIAPEDLAHLFDPFRRGSNVRGIPGTGLGLCIAQKCAHAHNGEIAVASELGSGTTFTVTLNCRAIAL